MKSRTFRLSESDLDLLESYASDHGISQAEAIRFAIQNLGSAIHGKQASESMAMSVLVDQLAVKDKQIADLSAALVSAQDTVKAAQALHAANVQQTALESGDHKKRKWPWNRKNG